MDFSYEEIVILHESQSIGNPYKQLNGCLFFYALCSWLARYALSRLLSLLQNSKRFMWLVVELVDTSSNSRILPVVHWNWKKYDAHPRGSSNMQVRVLPSHPQIPSIFEGWMQRLAPQAYAENRLSDIFGAVSAKSGRLTDFDNLGIWASGIGTMDGQLYLKGCSLFPLNKYITKVPWLLTTGCP